MLIGVDVPSGSVADYLEWQRRTNDVAATFPGFVGAEVIQPVPGVQDRWTCLYRFRSAAELKNWLESDARHVLLDEMGGRFRDVRQRTLSDDDADGCVTLVASHRVPESRVPEFLRVQAEADHNQATFPGYRGTKLLRPVAGAQPEWTALIRFDTEEHLRAWMTSEQRARLIRALNDLGADFDTDVVGSSFGSWFSFAMRDGETTPNWKQWLTVLLVLYPVVMVLGLLTKYLPGGADSPDFPPDRWFFLNMWVGNFLSTLLLTFAVMPLVTRAMRRWLDPRASGRVTAIGLGVVVIVSVVTLLIFDRACAGGC